MQTAESLHLTSSSTTTRTPANIALNKAQAAAKLDKVSNSGTTAAAVVNPPPPVQQSPQFTNSALQQLSSKVHNLNTTPIVNTTMASSNFFTPSQLVSDETLSGLAQPIAAAAASSSNQTTNAAATDNPTTAAPLILPPPSSSSSSSPSLSLAPVPPVIVATAGDAPLPASFLAMQQTKLRQSQAIALYRTEQQALNTARAELATFELRCNKRQSVVTLPHSMRSNFIKARFVEVDGIANFYKEEVDQLSKLEEETATSAFALIVTGKKKYIAHTNKFITRASSTYSDYVTELNRLFSQQGSTTAYPLNTAVAQFKIHLKKEMDLYIAQQVEAQLVAQSKKKETAQAERDAEEKIVAGSHNGTNISHIATKAATNVVKQSNEQLVAMVTTLQEQVNQLSRVPVPSSRQPTAAAVKHASTAGKRKIEQGNSKKKKKKKTKQDHTDDMDIDNEQPVVSFRSSSLSNSQGGGRKENQVTVNHKSKKQHRYQPAAGKKKRTRRSKVKQENESLVCSTAYDRQLVEFGRHTPAWLDALIHCTGIHDFTTSSTITPLQRRFLANGLRFICTPPKTQLSRFSSHIIDPTNITEGFNRFKNTLKARFIFSEEDQKQTRIHEKFRLKGRNSHFIGQLEESHRTDEVGLDLYTLDQYHKFTQSLLQQAAESASRQIQSTLHYRVNFKPKEREFIQCLIQNKGITCKPADKNLGLVLVDTDWYVDKLRTMLNDRVTYSIVASGSSNTPSKINEIQNGLIKKLLKIAREHENTIKSYDSDNADLIMKFLQHRVNKTGAFTPVIPTIYGIIKVHKPALSMRPIVPCTRAVTTAASVLVDELLQQVVRNANITWIVKDTKSLIVELESTVLPTQDGDFITADVASLYTNIDTDDGLKEINRFLTEQQVESSRHKLIMDLLEFVMRNSYLQFRDTVYKQDDGTAMGTACAPTYANIYVYMKERIVIADLLQFIRLYRRFLDDIFAFIARDKIEEFKQRMNELHPKLKFEFVTHSTEAVFLDLCIYKGRRFEESSIFDLRVHQKSMNLYLYIPWTSFHTDAAKRSFIQTELMRYVRNSSDREDYLHLKQLFYGRLRDRGYLQSFLQPLFTDAVRYSDRHYFLYPSADLISHSTIFTHPPQSTCLQKRIARIDRLGSGAEAPPVFVTSDNPLTRSVPIRNLLSEYWSMLTDINPNLPRPIIAYRTWPSLASVLVFQKAKRNEETRIEKFKQSSAEQSSIKSFFITQPKSASRINSDQLSHSSLNQQ